MPKASQNCHPKPHIFLYSYIPTFLKLKGALPRKLFMPNKPNSKTHKIAITPYSLMPNANYPLLFTYKNEPKQTQFFSVFPCISWWLIYVHPWFKMAKNGTVWDKFGVVLDTFGVFLDNFGIVLDCFGSIKTPKNRFFNEKTNLFRYILIFDMSFHFRRLL